AQHDGARGALAVGPYKFELRFRRVVDLAQVVADADDVQPVAFGIDHAPGGQVVEGGAPEHGLLAASVHGDVAARTGGIGRGRVDGEHETGRFGGIGNAAGDDAGTRVDGGNGFCHTRQLDVLHRRESVKFFGVDDGRAPGEGNGAAGVA